MIKYFSKNSPSAVRSGDLLSPASAAGALLLLVTALPGQAQIVLSQSTGPEAPSFRGQANTTYFGWPYGTWDGNEDLPTDTLDSDVLTSALGLNPAGLSGISLVRNPGPATDSDVDIVSGSNNIYTASDAIDLTLTIPVIGDPSTPGFTTIIIQGNSLAGGGTGFYNGEIGDLGVLDIFSFSAINGVQPTYIRQANLETETQWWAKWEIPGYQSIYEVRIDSSGLAKTSGLLSVSDMIVDTQWSPVGYAPDMALARAIPEPSAALLALGAVGLMAGRRPNRRRGTAA